MDRFDIRGQVAVITGAGGSIGKVAAMALAEAGADLALIGRDASKLEATRNAAERFGGRIIVAPADIRDERSVRDCAALILDTFGRTDILFNNAGTSSPKAFLEYTFDDWKTIIETNLTGTFLCSRAFVPAMIERKYGRIINMGSILSGRGMARRSAYAASKAGLSNLGASLAFEFGPYGITVNTIGATVMVTDFNREMVRSQPELYEGVRRRSAFGRLGEIDDIIGTLIFLASPASAYLTGQTIYVDGGYTAG
jgi:NAD(P)-dependent dehydrogenase (short-subunit alcohol dehydrogenase family)